MWQMPGCGPGRVAWRPAPTPVRQKRSEGREERLVDGRGVFKLSGIFTVSGADKAGLEAACSDLERAAGAAKVCLPVAVRPAEGGATWALPFGRGL